jgi:DNA-directed RNA polymerase beta subunit
MLMNRSAIEKGLFRAQALKKYFETIKKNPASSQTGIFMKPDITKVDIPKDANYNKLSEEGYAKPETYIQDGDVIIGMVNPKPVSREDEKPYKDNSTIYRSLVPGAIDRVFTGLNSDGYPIIKIRVRSERIPQEGDKFSSRAGSPYLEPESEPTLWLVYEQ